MKAIFLAILLQGIFAIGQAQYTRHIIELTDKRGTVHSLSNPQTFLSAETIARRKQFNIAIDSTDLPVSKVYLDSIAKAGKVEILNSSKWLNQVLIKTSDQAALNKISQFPFVKKRFQIANRPHTNSEEKFIETITETNLTQTVASTKATTLNYGNSIKQVNIHEGEFLHNKGFQGNGIKIAVLDAGFFKYQNIAAFDSLKINGQLKMTWDFVDNNASVNEDDAHGMQCLSILAANLPGAFVGTAPASSYYLFRTEDVASEFPVEEQNWLAAAERADSIGAQMISSSLGYNTFDDASFNYTYADMNGKKTMITRGATMASTKGDSQSSIYVPLCSKFALAEKVYLIGGPALDFSLDSAETENTHFGYTLGGSYELNDHLSIDTHYSFLFAQESQTRQLILGLLYQLN